MGHFRPMTTATALSDPATGSTRGPFRLAVATCTWTAVCTIWLGALTTSTGSGLAYLTWPLSDGEWMPVSSYTELPQFFEHFHRVSGAVSGLLALTLWLWLYFGRVGTSRARGLAFFGGLLNLIQGLIGGTHVLEGLPVATGVVHGTLAQLTLATYVWVAYQLSSRFREQEPLADVPTGSGRKLALAGFVIVVVQTVLGAVARHSNSSHALWTHVGNALVVFVVASIATAFAVGKLGKARGIPRLTQLIVLGLIVQIALGFVALAVRNEDGKQPENVENLGVAMSISVHVLLGAVLTAGMAALAAHVFRATRRPDGPSAEQLGETFR